MILYASDAASTPRDNRVVAASSLPWAELLTEIERARKRADHGNEHWQDEYVEAVAHLASRVDLRRDAGFQALVRKASGALRPAFTNLEKSVTFQITLISFSAGDILPAHDHPDMTAVSLCTAGSIRVETFDQISRTTNDFLLRKAADVILRAVAETTSQIR